MSVFSAVRNLVAAHARAQDTGRTEDVVSLYEPDGVLEMTGADPIAGHEALRAAFKSWEPTGPQLHLVGNTVLTAWTEDEATAESDVLFVNRVSVGGGNDGWAPQIVGHYVDTLRRHGDAWLIHHRTATFQ